MKRATRSKSVRKQTPPENTLRSVLPCSAPTGVRQPCAGGAVLARSSAAGAAACGHGPGSGRSAALGAAATRGGCLRRGARHTRERAVRARPPRESPRPERRCRARGGPRDAREWGPGSGGAGRERIILLK